MTLTKQQAKKLLSQSDTLLPTLKGGQLISQHKLRAECFEVLKNSNQQNKELVKACLVANTYSDEYFNQLQFLTQFLLTQVSVITHPKKGQILLSDNAIKAGDIVYMDLPFFSSNSLTEQSFNHLQSEAVKIKGDSLTDLPLALEILHTWPRFVESSSIQTVDYIREQFNQLYCPVDQPKPYPHSLETDWKDLLLLVSIYSKILDVDISKYWDNNEHAARLVAKIKNNAFTTQSLLYSVSSKLSHSCIPNCSWHTLNLHDKDVFVLRALCDISPGEELTIAYHTDTSLGNIFNISTQERRKFLIQSKYFLCECELCMRPDKSRTFHCMKCQQGTISLNPHPTKKKKVRNQCTNCKTTSENKKLLQLEKQWENSIEVCIKRLDDSVSSYGEKIQIRNKRQLESLKLEIERAVESHWLLYEIHAILYHNQTSTPLQHLNFIKNFLEMYYEPRPISECVAYWLRQLGECNKKKGNVQQALDYLEKSLNMFEIFESTLDLFES